MGTVIATIKIMPTSPEVDLEAIKIIVKEKIASFAGEGETKSTIEPVAFGLNSLSIIFVMDEDLGSPDVLSEQVAEMKEVNSAEIVDVRRAIG